MQFLLMTYVNESGWKNLTPAEQERGVVSYVGYVEALTNAGVLKGMNRLQSSAAATTVRIDNGERRVFDGPYAETKEQFGGYFLVEVADRDAAIAWAARCPAASHGVVEIRPLWSATA